MDQKIKPMFGWLKRREGKREKGNEGENWSFYNLIKERK